MAGTVTQPAPTTPNGEVTAPDKPPGAPRAVVWISGLGGARVDQSVTKVAHRLAAAFDANATSRDALFTVGPAVTNQTFGVDGELTTDVCTIFRAETADGTPAPVVDVYSVPMADALRATVTSSGALRQILLLVQALLIARSRGLSRIGTGFVERSKATQVRQRWQGLVSQIYVVAALVYLLWLVVCAGYAAYMALTGDQPISAEVLLGSVLPAAVLPVIVPKVRALIAGAGQANASMVGAIRYLDGIEGRAQARGRVTQLLEHIGEQPQYADVKIISYSFGTIAAIDAIFPTDLPAEPCYAKVTGLATIGCPFDYVRTYWETYFDERRMQQGNPETWINVCRPGDVFASNFRQDGTMGPAQLGPMPVAGDPPPPPVTNRYYPPGADPGALRSIVGALLLAGLQQHAMYWDTADSATQDAFSLAGRGLFDQSPVLA